MLQNIVNKLKKRNNQFQNLLTTIKIDITRTYQKIQFFFTLSTTIKKHIAKFLNFSFFTNINNLLFED